MSALTPADEAAIRESMDRYVQAVLAGDHARLASFFTEDAVVNPALEPAIKGHAEIQAWHEKLPAITDFRVTITVIEGRDDLAYVLGRTALGFRPPGAAAPLNQVGKFVEIRRKQPDGRWLISVDFFSSDAPRAPVPTPSEAPR